MFGTIDASRRRAGERLDDQARRLCAVPDKPGRALERPSMCALTMRQLARRAQVMIVIFACAMRNLRREDLDYDFQGRFPAGASRGTRKDTGTGRVQKRTNEKLLGIARVYTLRGEER